MSDNNSGIESAQYNNEFFYQSLSGSMRSAKEILPLIFGGFRPVSVLDVGCGLGDWLFVAESYGAKDIYGVDGDYIDKSRLKIPLEKYQTHDLKTVLKLDRKFDLVMSLEVGEHIPDASADMFVESLTSHGDLILFSAAIPGQTGVYHINEQWPSYWAAKFLGKNFIAKDLIRPVIWSNNGIEWWYRQNCILFINKEKVHQYDHLLTKLQSLQQDSDLDKVLPEIFQDAVDGSKEWQTSMWTIPKHFLNAFRRVIKKFG